MSNTEVSNHRRLLRLALGGVALAGERVMTGVRRAERLRSGTPPDAGLDPPSPEGALSTEGASSGDARPAPRHVVIGALVALPGWWAGWARRIAPLPHAARATVDRGLRHFGFLARLPPARQIERRLHALRESWAAYPARWGRIGLEEERRGRITAEQAFHELSASIMTTVADSPDLQDVISEQTSGLTRSALTSLRTRAQRADDLSESIANRVRQPHPTERAQPIEPADAAPPTSLEFHGPGIPHPAR